MLCKVYKTSCCCIDLFTVGCIIGMLGSVAALVCIISSAVFLMNGEDFVEFKQDTFLQENRHYVKSALICSIVWNTIEVFAAIILVFGAAKAKRWMLLPWLVNHSILLLTFGLIYIKVIYYCFGTTFAMGLAHLIIGYYIIKFSGYIWALVWSLYSVMGMDPDKQTEILGYNPPNFVKQDEIVG